MADRAGQRGGGFEAFAAIAQLPTHNQQTRMVAGADLHNHLAVGSSTSSDSASHSLRAVLERAKANLCHLDCVGVMEDLDPLVRCVSKQLVGVAKSKKNGQGPGLRLESSNSIQKHKAQGGVTTTEAISAAARSTVMRISWADAELHAFAKDLVARRLD